MKMCLLSKSRIGLPRRRLLNRGTCWQAQIQTTLQRRTLCESIHRCNSGLGISESLRNMTYPRRVAQISYHDNCDWPLVFEDLKPALKSFDLADLWSLCVSGYDGRATRGSPYLFIHISPRYWALSLECLGDSQLLVTVEFDHPLRVN